MDNLTSYIKQKKEKKPDEKKPDLDENGKKKNTRKQLTAKESFKNIKKKQKSNALLENVEKISEKEEEEEDQNPSFEQIPKRNDIDEKYKEHIDFEDQIVSK